ncbi:MAG TPA: BlaI/MecI/CopY family transcriptional regulator [Phycisphaerae bacterium]|nr:BlaI/MecI/CopY family transcriptional regulator [Phycisphaerae bacterium]
MTPVPTAGNERSNFPAGLSRREREIMDIVYARSGASATEVLEDMPDAPSRDTVRTILRILEAKGHLRHTKRGREFVYRPTASKTLAGRSALDRVIRTFFGGSLSEAFALHLVSDREKIPPKELDRLSELIRQAKKK